MNLNFMRFGFWAFLVLITIPSRADFISPADSRKEEVAHANLRVEEQEEFKFMFNMKSALQTRIQPLLKAARQEYRFFSTACQGGSAKSVSCRIAKKKVMTAHNKLKNDPLVRGGVISPASIKDCIYAAMVTCSLLGGPNPDSQGLSPLSSLAGKGLTEPLNHYRKDVNENGDPPAMR